MFLTGLTVFTTASLVSATASSAATMIMSRAAQGTGAAMLTPAALSIIVTTYTGKQRSTALAIWGTIGSMGIAAGVLLGGVLTTTLGWRSIFFVNVPIGIVAAVLTLRTVARNRGNRQHARTLDVPGAATLVTGLLAMVYAIENAGTHGWTSTQTIVGSTVSHGAARPRSGSSSVTSPRRWSPRPPGRSGPWCRPRPSWPSSPAASSAPSSSAPCSSSRSSAPPRSSPAWSSCRWQQPSPSVAAVASARHRPRRPEAPDGRRAPGRRHRRRLLAGMDANPSYLTDVLPGFIVLGLGTGPMFVAISIVAMSGISHEQSGLASGVMMTGHEVGAALGVASPHRHRRRPDHPGRAHRRLPDRLHRHRGRHGRPLRVRRLRGPEREGVRRRRPRSRDALVG